MGEDVLGPGGPLMALSLDPPLLRRGRPVPLVVGELPQPRQQPPVRPAAEGHGVLMEDHPHRALLHSAGLLWSLHRQLPHPALDQGGAKALCRALPAQRRAVGQAHGGPQLHQGLVEGPRPVHGDRLLQRLGHLFLHPRRGDVPIVPADPGVHPQHVAVHGRDSLPKGDGADGPGGVVPHPRQGPDRGVVRRKLTAVLLHDDFCSLFQVPGPGVVAQPLPQLHQPLLGKRRQRGHIRGFFQKPLVVVQHRRHPGLLEHDLRQPHVVGGGVVPPGEGAGVVPEPLQQGEGQSFQRVHGGSS